MHQKPEVAVIASEQHIGFAGVGSSVNRPVFLGKISRTGDGGVVGHQPNLAELMTELRQAIGSFAFEVADQSGSGRWDNHQLP